MILQRKMLLWGRGHGHPRLLKTWKGVRTYVEDPRQTKRVSAHIRERVRTVLPYLVEQQFILLCSVLKALWMSIQIADDYW